MTGMSGAVGTRSMPENCGMQGMHSNQVKNQIQKPQDSSASSQLQKRENIVSSSKIDVRI